MMPTSMVKAKSLSAPVPQTRKAISESEVTPEVMSVRPSISETLEWVRALTVLNVEQLDRELCQETLNLVLKYEGDLERANEKLGELFPRKPV